ncbi:hypothetical protein D3C80_2041760 [compost metagenome]
MSPTSTSALVSVPLMVVVVSSLTSPAALPLIVGASLLPSMVITTLALVPSAVNTSRVSVSVLPTPKA